jgi:hypothetical protein
VLDPLPTLTWEVAGRRVSRTVARLHHEPAVVLVYQLEGAEPAALEVRRRCSPTASRRRASARTRRCARKPPQVGPDFILQPYPGVPAAGPAHGGRDLGCDPHWYRGFRYVMDAGERGLAGGPLQPRASFRLVLRPGPPPRFTAWAGAIPPSTDPMVRVASERRRIRGLGDANEGFLPDLRRAADGFVVRAPSAGRAIGPAIPRA